MSLSKLLQRADIWRGGENLPLNAQHRALSSGYKALDEALPGGGWPVGAITEVLCQHLGVGELQLLLPSLVQLSQKGQWIVWVDPPYLPYAPSLRAMGIDLSRIILVRPQAPTDDVWAIEQALRTQTCGAVLGWAQKLNTRILRRLQLAAEAGNVVGILFRPLSELKTSSPAALRLHLQPAAAGITLHIVKRRGGWSHRPILLSFKQTRVHEGVHQYALA